MHRWARVFPAIIGYKLFRTVNIPKLMPISMTVSVTNQCNSRCGTCNIWKLYKHKPQLKSKELSLQEFEKIFESIGRSVIWFTISGGEPFLRQDLVDICKSIHENCRPQILSIPTNGLLPHLIERETKDILDVCQETTVMVNLSLDGVGDVHDKIRGVQGNFENAMDTYNRLKALKDECNNLELGVHSVVSRFNVDRLLNVYKYIKRELNPDSYICEIAEHRSELFNTNNDITPDIFSYERCVEKLRKQLKEDYLIKRGLSKLIQSFRLEYYNLAVKELEEKRQVIPCYAGFASCQISAYGDVWPCCILAYNASVGNLREVAYEFKRIWLSERADEIRRMIKAGICYCPMANAHYTNMLCDTKTMLKVAYNAVLNRTKFVSSL